MLLLIFGIINVFYLLVFFPWYAKKKRLNLWRKPFSHLGSRNDTYKGFKHLLSIALVFQYLFFVGLINILVIPTIAIYILTVATVAGIIPAFYASRNHFWIHTIFGLTAIFGSFFGGLIINVKFPIGHIGLISNVIMATGFLYLFYEKFLKRRCPDFNCIGELILFAGISFWNVIYFIFAMSKL